MATIHVGFSRTKVNTTPSDERRFWKKVDKSGDCWMWTAGSGAAGKYGMFGFGGTMIRAHRFAYELCKGEIGVGLFVCHSCDTPRCVNPDHLWLGTAGDNARDMSLKGRCIGQKSPERMARGDKNGARLHP